MKYVLKQDEDVKWSDEELEAKKCFRPGMKLYGFCEGIFGGTWQGMKTIKKIEGDVLTCEIGSYAPPCEYHIEITSWISLLESSNKALETGEYQR